MDNNFSFSGEEAADYLKEFLQKLIDLGVDIIHFLEILNYHVNI